ncbi:GNAT family N-acetyltransferase [Bradyrhizobium prioriisuperbiae]|uniref:GNAT family N-acetyltransferase n=1 Tax=Bradyrhizobium prioriisuperbiae TaxID=2854389 RepID=UPI0028E5F5D5|nr:GNAT family N-acetyltransferase [Bradyrhizobium prioritasuperba]
MFQGIVRKARPDDAPAIAAVHVSVSRETYAHLFSAEELGQFSVAHRARQWHAMIGERDRADLAVFVAESAADKTISGFGCCSRQRSDMLVEQGFNGEFQSIYILPPAQGRGLGRALMAEMARYLSALAISGGACWVLRGNAGAHRFYEALGGEIVGEQALGPDTEATLTQVAYGWRNLAALSGD